MKVFVEAPQGLSRAMMRVAHALTQTAADLGFEVVSKVEQAELVFLHVIGFPETELEVERLRFAGKKYAIIQYCLRTTQQPTTGAWLNIWRGAEVVWSYYDLHAIAEQDGRTLEGVNTLLTPLGVASTFRTWDIPKRAEILTSGYVAESETVREAFEAARRVGGKVVHLGPQEQFPDAGDHIAFVHNINDGILSQIYAKCKYVAGLRRGEGFELPAAEGLLCGARPICYDAPHYRMWYGDFAEYVTEGSPEEVANQLEAIFRKEYRPVTEEELVVARARFDWDTITSAVWQAVRRKNSTALPKSRVKRKRKLLWVGDAVVASGFAKATHETLETLVDDWEVEVIGLNYFGEPHDYPYRIRPAVSRKNLRDGFGIRTMVDVATAWGPDVIVVQNDPWNVPAYMKAAGSVPVIATIAVDGHNVSSAPNLNGLVSANFWTRFGQEEAHRCGYRGPSTVIGLGVDLDVFKERTPSEKRKLRQLNVRADQVDGFIVGNANRNQPRKRLDLTVRYFCEWVKRFNVPDAYLYLHVAPTGDAGYDVKQLMDYFGLPNRLILSEPEIGFGISEDGVANTYSLWDLQVSTTQGEGWGLTTLEGMACGIPQLVPEWSALKEWSKGAAIHVPCTSIAVTPNNINTIGGVPDEEFFVEMLQQLYSNRQILEDARKAGLELARRPEFNWTHISQKFGQMVHDALGYR